MEKRQEQFISEVTGMLKNVEAQAAGQSPAADDWSDMLEVQKILNVSRRTAFRIRDDNQVRWKQIRGRTHFYAPDIFALRSRYLK